MAAYKGDAKRIGGANLALVPFDGSVILMMGSCRS